MSNHEQTEHDGSNFGYGDTDVTGMERRSFLTVAGAAGLGGLLTGRGAADTETSTGGYGATAYGQEGYGSVQETSS